MGCELIGNKQQGEKGVLFTASYVKRFNEMEKCSKDIASKLIESQASELKDLSEKVDRLYKLLGVYVEKNNLLESCIYDDSMLHGKSTIRGDVNLHKFLESRGCDISKKTLRKILSNKQIPTVYNTGRTKFYRVEDVLKWMRGELW